MEEQAITFGEFDIPGHGSSAEHLHAGRGPALVRDRMSEHYTDGESRKSARLPRRCADNFATGTGRGAR
jgi:hypothetical protein